MNANTEYFVGVLLHERSSQQRFIFLIFDRFLLTLHFNKRNFFKENFCLLKCQLLLWNVKGTACIVSCYEVDRYHNYFSSIILLPILVSFFLISTLYIFCHLVWFWFSFLFFFSTFFLFLLIFCFCNRLNYVCLNDSNFVSALFLLFRPYPEDYQIMKQYFLDL